jgi:hypothetical protein
MDLGAGSHDLSYSTMLANTVHTGGDGEVTCLLALLVHILIWTTTMHDIQNFY